MGGRGLTTLAAVAIVTSSVAFAAPANAERNDDKAARAGLPTIADQMTYRAELGLPSSREVVTDLNAKWASGSMPDATVEGSVFTPSEEAELDAREDAAHEIATVARSSSFADVLGGIYIDPASGKTVVLLTGDMNATLSALRDRVAHPDRLVGKPARFSLADLTRAGDTVMAKHARYGVTGTSVDERNNTLDVLLAADTAEARAGVVSLLRPTQAQMVRFQQSAGPETLGVGGSNSPPVKGGQGVNVYRTNGTAGGCTSAFVGYTPTRTDIGISVNTYYALSAGHCDKILASAPKGARLRSRRRGGTRASATDGEARPRNERTTPERRGAPAGRPGLLG